MMYAMVAEFGTDNHISKIETYFNPSMYSIIQYTKFQRYIKICVGCTFIHSSFPYPQRINQYKQLQLDLQWYGKKEQKINNGG